MASTRTTQLRVEHGQALSSGCRTGFYQIRNTAVQLARESDLAYGDKGTHYARGFVRSPHAQYRGNLPVPLNLRQQPRALPQSGQQRLAILQAVRAERGATTLVLTSYPLQPNIPLKWPLPLSSSDKPSRTTASSRSWAAGGWVWCTRPRTTSWGASSR